MVLDVARSCVPKNKEGGENTKGTVIVKLMGVKSTLELKLLSP